MEFHNDGNMESRLIRTIHRTAINEPFRIAITGHRKWGNYSSMLSSLNAGITNMLAYVIEVFGIKKENIIFIHGTASGVDVAFGQYAFNNRIKFSMYFPFDYEIQREHAKWTPTEQRWIDRQRKAATSTAYIANKFYTYAYQARNIEMVNDCDMLAMYFTRSKSGSGNCFRYAKQKGRLCVDLMELSKAPTESLAINRVHEFFY